MQKWILALPTSTIEQSIRRGQLMTELESVTKLLGDMPGVEGASPFVFTHCDLLSWNVIIKPSPSSAAVSRRSSTLGGSEEPEPAAIVSFIDYEYAMLAPASFDLSNHFVEWGGFDCDASAMHTRSTRRAFISLEIIYAVSAHTRTAHTRSRI
ncbi:hypothetical protein PMIN04_012141 [Paraphaeosphaeria minitans]